MKRTRWAQPKTVWVIILAIGFMCNSPLWAETKQLMNSSIGIETSTKEIHQKYKAAKEAYLVGMNPWRNLDALMVRMDFYDEMQRKKSITPEMMSQAVKMAAWDAFLAAANSLYEADEMRKKAPDDLQLPSDIVPMWFEIYWKGIEIALKRALIEYEKRNFLLVETTEA